MLISVHFKNFKIVVIIRIQERINRENLPLKMMLQVHDELVFECPVVVVVLPEVSLLLRTV